MADIAIDVIDRGRIETDINYPLEGARMATSDRPNPDAVRGEGVVYNLVLDHPDGTILWDTGSHPDAGSGHWPEDLYQAFTHVDAAEHPLDGDLADAGYDLDDIDYVVQSHLHLDHAGGLHQFDGTDVPVFVHEREFQFAYYSAKTDQGDAAYIAGDFDHDLNWRIVHGEREQHFEDIEFIHLPGHTPGLMGMLVERNDSHPVLFIGDQAYVAANYEDAHPLGAALLWSRPDWEESLHRLRDIERRRDPAVVYGHDPEQFEDIKTGWQ